MKKAKFIRILPAIFLCLALLTPAVLAAGADKDGSLRVIEIEESVRLYHVAGADGVLSETFAGAELEDFPQQATAVKNAQTLADYALANDIPCNEQTPGDEGWVIWRPLNEGLYLVTSAADEAEFKPFLVKIPTELNGKTIYNIEAKPKGDQPTPTPGPSTPPTPTPTPGPDTPNIPQTGDSVVPKYVLLALGALMTVAGIVELIRGREQDA